MSNPRRSPGRMALAAVSAAALLACCGGQGGWSSGDKDALRSELCEDVSNIDRDSAACDCVVAVVLQYFDSPGAAQQAESPPAGYIASMQRCAQ